MKTAFIINPAAGRNRTARVWPRLEAEIRTRGTDFKVFFTSGKGKGREAAIQAQATGCEKLVVVGGDGSLHEVINGADLRQSCIGIIPTGSGNDFCRTLKIPRDPFCALEVALDGKPGKIDLGEVNGTLFANVAGVGFDAQIAGEVNNNPRLHHLLGTSAYVAAVVKTLLSYRNVPAEIAVDRMIVSANMFLTAVGNGCYYGGGMKILPDACVDDGQLNVCIGVGISPLDAVVILPKIFSGGHVGHPKISFLNGSRVKVTTRVPLPVHADGEIVSTTPAIFRVIPRCLNLIHPGLDRRKEQ